MPMQTPPMGLLDLKARAQAGDPQAIQMLQELQGGGGAPQQPMPAPGGMPPMSQSQFGNGGQPVPPDVAAQRAQQLIQILRARGG